VGRHGEEMEERGGGSGMLDQNQRTGALGGPGPSHPSSYLPGRGPGRLGAHWGGRGVHRQRHSPAVGGRVPPPSLLPLRPPS